MRTIIFSAMLAFSAISMPSAASATNLVTNGDFEAGDTGFTTVYTTGNLLDERKYAVDTNPANQHFAWVNVGDHTTGSGLMFIGNGSPNVGDIVWQSGSISIAAGTDYFFEAFVMNVCCILPFGVRSAPVLTFSVSLDGSAPLVLGTRTVGDAAGVWYGLSTNFASGSATSAVLSLINSNAERTGNDFAVDDISLSTRSVVTPVPEAATWAMLIAGFGMVGASVRRQRQIRTA